MERDHAVTAYVALGANLGDPLRQVRQALADLDQVPQTRVTQASRWYRSAPIGGGLSATTGLGGDYINGVAQLQTGLTAYALLDALQDLEERAGRPGAQSRASTPNAPRTLDLDLLLYGESYVDGPRLQIPHPRMWSRAFVLLPLSEVAPHWVSAHALAAVAGQTIAAIG